MPATTPSTSAAGRHPGRITNSKDPDIAYLEARRRLARVEERIKEAKECGLTNFPDSSFQANRGPLLPVEMAQVLLAWARRPSAPELAAACGRRRSLPLTSDLLITPAAHLGERQISMPSARLSTAA